MQAIVSVNRLAQVKLFFANPYLEKVLIIAKMVCLFVVLVLGTTYIDGQYKKDFAFAIESLTDANATWTENTNTYLYKTMKEVDRYCKAYNFELVAVAAVTFSLTDNAVKCSDLECLATLQNDDRLFASSVQPTDRGLCLQEDCEEFKAVTQVVYPPVFFDLKPKSVFQLSLDKSAIRPEGNPATTNLSTIIGKLQRNNWLNDTSGKLSLAAAIQNSYKHALVCVVAVEWPIVDRLSPSHQILVHCSSASDTEFVFLVIIAIIVAASLVKPMLESSVAASKWIYCAGVLYKVVWFVWTVLRLGAHSASKNFLKGNISIQSVTDLDNINSLSSCSLQVLLAVLPFELLKLGKRQGSFGQFAQLMSALYGTALSALSYLVLVSVLFACLAAGVYGWLHDYAESNLLVFIGRFIGSDLNLDQASDLEKIFYAAASVYRYLLWTYFLAAFVFYFKLVTTHIFSTFEPKYFKTMMDRLSTINKAMDNFSNDMLLKPVTTGEAKRREVIIWLNYGFHEESGQRLTYSLPMLEIFKDVEKRSVGLSFFSEFRQVRAFLKSIFNIIPKAMMSTAKGVRVVVRVGPSGKVSRNDYELQIFAHLNELSQFISDMGLDIEVLVYDEHVANVFASRIYSIVESSFAKVKVTNSSSILKSFCAMMALEDFGPEPDEIYSSNIFEETEENI